MLVVRYTMMNQSRGGGHIGGWVATTDEPCAFVSQECGHGECAGTQALSLLSDTKVGINSKCHVMLNCIMQLLFKCVGPLCGGVCQEP
jgi:hypothetical protein